MVSGFLSEGIDLRVAVYLVCLYDKEKSATSYSAILLMSLYLHPFIFNPCVFTFNVSCKEHVFGSYFLNSL